MAKSRLLSPSPCVASYPAHPPRRTESAPYTQISVRVSDLEWATPPPPEMPRSISRYCDMVVSKVPARTNIRVIHLRQEQNYRGLPARMPAPVSTTPARHRDASPSRLAQLMHTGAFEIEGWRMSSRR